jgi:hypothetical protein
MGKNPRDFGRVWATLIGFYQDQPFSPADCVNECMQFFDIQISIGIHEFVQSNFRTNLHFPSLLLPV